MRAFLIVLVAVLMSACNGSSSADTPGADTPATDPPATGPIDGFPLSELLPNAVSGEETSKGDMNVASRNSPRVFLKTVARLDKTPPDGEVAFAKTANASVYALRVDELSGFEILEAFTAEIANVTAVSVPQPTLTVGGKLVTPVGELPGVYFYSSGDVFYYIQCADDPTAVDLLSQLP